jgi:hypothetical protein
MVDVFDLLYSKIRVRSGLLSKLRYYSFIRFVTRRIANIVLPFYFRLTNTVDSHRLDVNNNNIGQGLILSLTSFPERIDTVWLTIETLLRQTIKADAIVLWLSKDQFSEMAALPPSLLKMCDRGLHIEFREGDLRSHKKFYYLKKEFPNATIVLADDDIFYPRNMLSDLVVFSKKFPGIVICRYAKKIRWTHDKELLPYESWEAINKGDVTFNTFFGSGGGVLIPPNAIHSDVLNKEVFLNLCPYADDIWLNAMCRLVSPAMVSVSKNFSLLPVLNRDKIDLSSINNGLLMNDRQLRLVRAYCLDKFKKDPFAPIESFACSV